MPLFAVTQSVLRSAGLAALAALVLCQGCGASKPSKKPVAVVNGETITEGQLSQALLDRAGVVVLRQIIDEMVIRQAATKAGVSASEKEIEAKLDELRARYPSAEDFDRMIADAGQTTDRLKENFELQILFEKLALKEVKVSDEECRQHYDQNSQNYVQQEQVQIRDIELESKDNAASVLKALKSKGDFAGLAKEFSTDPATKDRGGDMGLLPLDSLQPHFKDQVAKLQPGELSGAFEGMGSWYVIKLEKRVKKQQRPFEECKDEIRDLLTRQNQQMVQAGLIERLRNEVKVEFKDPKLTIPELVDKQEGDKEEGGKAKGKTE